MVFIRAKDLGPTGARTPQEIDANGELLARIKKMRSIAAERVGLWMIGEKQYMNSLTYRSLLVVLLLHLIQWTTGEMVK